ncbi:MAG: phenylalanine--tRNA ligase subunit beta [Pseudomonadota bacterium]
MKFSEAWLREFVNPDWDTDTLSAKLTMTGLEVDYLLPAAEAFSSIVVAELLEVSPHPDAEKLRVCRVNSGSAEHNIVCGASNVYPGMRAPLAVIGAKLPGGIKIRKSKLRGVESEGMLCSGKELGLTEDADGILELPKDAPVGEDFRAFLQLDDNIFDLDLTPNRGDCLSILGVAREVAAAAGQSLPEPEVPRIAGKIVDKLNVQVDVFEECPRFAGRVVKNISTDAVTPLWMEEKLRRSGLRAIHPVVDITNFVMLELGQPMHAFDLATLDGGIVVRHGKPGERLTLLDGEDVDLEGILAVCDEGSARAVAGVKGGLGSGVTTETTDIFFEAAYWTPKMVAQRARKLGLHTDASHRFERGVDPNAQIRAIERATELLLDLAGGEPGPVIVVASKDHLPKRDEVNLRRDRIPKVLGMEVRDEDVEQALNNLGMVVERTKAGWRVRPPTYRFDIEIEEDLIEEVARLVGYDNLPEYSGAAQLFVHPDEETRIPSDRFKEALVDRGYREAMTYSFFDPVYQKKLFPNEDLLSLANPISEDLSAMRVSLWPGLLDALDRNLRRQRERVRLFEFGKRFLTRDGKTKEQLVLSGVVSGSVEPESWGGKQPSVSFFDIKHDVDALLALTGDASAFEYQPGGPSCLHPGQSAEIKNLTGESLGYLGALHPGVQKTLQIERKVYLFELLFEQLSAAKLPSFEAISKYPEIRRDIALVVDEQVPVGELCTTAREAAGNCLRETVVFDIYRGEAIESGRKSVALGLILQDKSRTLKDEDADKVVSGVVAQLKEKYNALIRE